MEYTLSRSNLWMDAFGQIHFPVMTVRRTVEMAEEQLAQFEQWAHEKGYAIVEDPNSEIPQEVMVEMMELAENWQPSNAIAKEQVLASFRTKGWDEKS